MKIFFSYLFPRIIKRCIIGIYILSALLIFFFFALFKRQPLSYFCHGVSLLLYYNPITTAVTGMNKSRVMQTQIRLIKKMYLNFPINQALGS